jgi:hypothetical protein
MFEQIKKPLLVAVDYVEQFVIELINVLSNHLRHISANALGIAALILLHSATIPSYIAMLSGIDAATPAVDLVLLVWMGLAAMFVQGIVRRDLICITVNAVGFMVQSTALALVFFR